MGWQDKLAAAADRMAAVVRENQDTIERSVDTAAKAADEKTGSRYSEQIRKAGEGLRSGLGRLTEPGGPDGRPR